MTSLTGLRPLAESELSEKAAETIARVRELFGAEPIPEAFFVYANAPVFLHDFYMNFKRFVLSSCKLDLKTRLLVAFSASVVLDCKEWKEFLASKLRATGACETEIAGAASVAAACSMYNVFYKFRSNAGTEVFHGMPVGLRAFTFACSGLDETTVEIINIAISNLNACKPCTAGHIAKAQSLGVSDEALLEAVQAAATIASGAVFLRAAE